MDRRSLARQAVLVLLSFCVSYGAPLGLALFLSGSQSACCDKGHSCCHKSHAAGWRAANSGCGGQCACAFPTPSAAPALTASPTRGIVQASHRAPAIRVHGPAPSAPYLAFLYQRPPPTTC